MCLFSSCNFWGGITPAAQTTTTASQGGDPLPNLSALSEAMKEAAPYRTRLTLTTAHAGLGELETACYILVGEGECHYYYYTSEYFLPLAEAIAAGEARGIRTGYLLKNSTAVTVSSPAIDRTLIEELQTYAIRRINLREDLLEECSITRAEGTILLTARVEADAAALVFDSRLDGTRAITLTVTFTEDGDLAPIACTVEMTAKDGTPTRYDAAYSYVAAVLPTAESAPNPDFSLWE